MESLEKRRRRVNILCTDSPLYKSDASGPRLSSSTPTAELHVTSSLSDSSLIYAIQQATETPAGTHSAQIELLSQIRIHECEQLGRDGTMAVEIQDLIQPHILRREPCLEVG